MTGSAGQNSSNATKLLATPDSDGPLNSSSHDTSNAKLVVTLFAWPNDKPLELAAIFGQREELFKMVFIPRFTVSEKVQWKNLEDMRIRTSEQAVEMALTLFKEEIQQRL